MTTVEATKAETEVPKPEPVQEKDGRVINVFSHGFLALWAAMVILPLIWVFINSLRSSGDINRHPIGWPTEADWSNFAGAWADAHIGEYFLNTLIVLAMSVTGTMLLGAMAAYVLARYDFWGNRVIYYGFVAGMMFPVFLALFPLYKILANIGLKDTFVGLALSYIAFSLPFTIFFLTAFFRTLPTSIAEAAMIDGAGHYRLFFQVMLPMAKSGIISITIFNIIGQWNQFILPLALMSTTEGQGQVLSVGLQELVGQAGAQTDTGVLFAAMSLAILPMVAAYVLFQRQIRGGMTAGAVK
ncbi:carbohydrate ABC transporter permease [Stackebrandtia nassauensis]|uniref:Binding-protein-dependent transport systems inner membrane component n=1 Tax=Stackebrandtia nassauensis (strain DSM 44728 / CIP 108903 / NRRL B-16338 / NBRC 102104 / LLR-40K-21) TaxID=446470 RepID=D3Q8F8_STANL|nr:carbohydrate ABC transporter permease [Stackebrandtia nassauensis]ADD42532.1 binding-protein-dependent transport systems inner membrane component [Stackebrandtia nassauensis DSM 44728]